MQGRAQPGPQRLAGQRPSGTLAPHEASLHTLLPKLRLLEPTAVELVRLYCVDDRLDHRGVALD